MEEFFFDILCIVQKVKCIWEGFWLNKELKKCKCSFVRLSDENLSRAHNIHQCWNKLFELFKYLGPNSDSMISFR